MCFNYIRKAVAADVFWLAHSLGVPLAVVLPGWCAGWLSDAERSSEALPQFRCRTLFSHGL